MSQQLGINRNPTQQDLSWFLDLHQWNQLELTPKYQRNSIWGRSDKLFFLNTIFNNYPCPAIYIQKDIVDGKSTYNVVDGKQRLQTVLDFFDNKLSMPSNFGDSRLNGKKWKEIEKDRDLANAFYNYKFTVEILSAMQNDQWGNVFDRLNRNSKTLSSQELRHARFEGWLISKVEAEVVVDEQNQKTYDEFWKIIGVSSIAKQKRMKDIELISVLMLVVLEKEFVGFPQSSIDKLYAKYNKITSEDDEPEYENFYFTEEDAKNYLEQFSIIKSWLFEIEQSTKLLTSPFFRKKTSTHIYSLWCYFVMNNIEKLDDKVPGILKEFFSDVEKISKTDSTGYQELVSENANYNHVIKYYEQSSGAATEEAQKRDRHEALTSYIKAKIG